MGLSAGRLAVETASKIIRTPEILVQIGRSMVRKRLTAPIDYHLHDGLSRAFSRVDIKIINACNLRCKMCGQWGETGWHLDQGAAFNRQIVPLDTYVRLMDEVADLKPWISIWGGEPFLYPHLMPLLRHIKRNALTVTVSTNGNYLDRHAAELVDMGLDFLYVSIDGSRAVHDRIRCLDGAFDKTVAGIRAVQERKKSLGSVKPYMVIAATVTQDNADRLEEVFEIGEELKADRLTTSYGWFQTPESCELHDAVMEEKLDTTPVSHRGWLWSYQQIDTAALVRSVRGIRSRQWTFPYVFLPELSYDEIPRYYTEHANTFGRDKCLFPWSVVEILPNGDVVTCGGYPDYKAGNIQEQGILEIWNNERYQKFRCVIKDELLPVCSRCCGLYGK